jgi:multiple antibiotic resistance protein
MPWADLQLVFTTAFVTLFVMVDPVGMIPIFASLTRAGDKQYRRDMAFKGTVVATLVLVSFAVIGEALLGFFGISMGAFGVAGGLLLFETRTKQRSERAEKTVSAHAPDDISVVPLAIPFLSGPGAITATILLMSQQSGNVMGQGAVMAALLLTMVVTYVCLLLTNPLLGVLSQTLITVITRLLGVILAALAVQFVIDGVRSALNLV